MEDKLKETPQVIDTLLYNFRTVLFLRGVNTTELLPYKVTKEMYASGKRQHLVEQVLQSDVGDPFELEIVYRLLLCIQNAYDSGELLRYTYHDGRVVSIKAVIKPDENKRVYITVAYSPYSRSLYGELVTLDSEKDKDSNREDKTLL